MDDFPLYWTPNPGFQNARHLEDLPQKDQGICEFFISLKVVFDTSTLLSKEYLFGALKAYTSTSPILPLTKKLKS